MGIEGSAQKHIIWAYDVEHDAFGGGSPSEGETYDAIEVVEAEAKGRAVAAEYTDAAVRRFLLGDSTAEPILTLAELPESLALELQWWDYLPANPDGRPMVFGAHVPSVREQPERRVQVDDMSRVATGIISPASTGLTVSLEGFSDVEAVRQNWANLLTGDPYHRTQVLDVRWTPQDQGSISWNVEELNLSTATHLSFRVANVTIVENGQPAGECIVETPPIFDLSFAVDLEGSGGARRQISSCPRRTFSGLASTGKADSSAGRRSSCEP